MIWLLINVVLCVVNVIVFWSEPNILSLIGTAWTSGLAYYHFLGLWDGREGET